MKLSKLCREYGRREGDAEITGLCTDSRVAGEGDLFFCFRGESVDSHAFAEEAFSRGAAAICCEKRLELPCPQVIVPDGREGMARLSAAFYQNPERKLKIVGVTGTNGKTTTCHLLFSALQESGRKVGLIGTLGARFGERVIPPDLTTPDPISLFSLLADMQRDGVEIVVMEVSAHALALRKVAPILFEVGIFTNLTRDHLDFFKEMGPYGEAKRSLFLPGSCKFGVYNADDEFSKKLLSLPTPHMTFGLKFPADASAQIVKESMTGTEAVFSLCGKRIPVSLNLTGRYNLSNALAAACAAEKLGAGAEEIRRGFCKLTSVEGRLERVATFRGAEIFVDFAHTPDGLEKALKNLKAHCKGKLIAVFGCGGNRDEGKRKLMGETAAKFSDYAVLTSDNPRFEEPCAIIREIEEGFSRISLEYTAIEEREKAIEFALQRLSEGDVLLVAGKGGETYQEIMGIKYEFNDKNVIRSLIERL